MIYSVLNRFQMKDCIITNQLSISVLLQYIAKFMHRVFVSLCLVLVRYASIMLISWLVYLSTDGGSNVTEVIKTDMDT